MSEHRDFERRAYVTLLELRRFRTGLGDGVVSAAFQALYFKEATPSSSPLKKGEERMC